MARFFTLETPPGTRRTAVAAVLAELLDKELARAALVPVRRSGGVVKQTLVSDPAQLDDVDPFAPVVWSSSAKLVSKLTFERADETIAVVLRSCEVRGLVELCKLNQGSTDSLLLIGMDCLGRLENRDFLALGAGPDDEAVPSDDVVPTCRACELPVAACVDIRLCTVGVEVEGGLVLEAVTEAGVAALERLALAELDGPPSGRDEAVAALLEERSRFAEALLAEFVEQTKDVGGLEAAVAACNGCYNCRVACPVCYCRECVFNTDTFRHDGERYLAWSGKHGQLEMPTDTVFYHLTRMLHVGALCVGCGQCTSACPNDVPVAQLLITAARKVQERFGYTPGLDPDVPQPLAVFADDELVELTGPGK